MTRFYDEIRGVAAEVLREFRQGAVTLTRTTEAASAPATPWEPGAPSTEVYTLDAVVSGVSAKYVDGTLILATDVMLTVSPRATLAGAEVDLEPQITDLISIDGAVAKAIKRIQPTPAAGTPAAFMIFIAG